tara:strand:- start:2029 stop:4635 length:2607 start_codon:yes stop_codon:yes gene_type:complete
MANSIYETNGDGSTTDFTIPYSYLEADDITAFVDGVSTSFTFTSDNVITFSTAPANGVAVRILRNTDVNSLNVTYSDGGALTAKQLNDSNTQLLFGVQEAIDTADEALSLDNDGKFDAQVSGTNRVIKNVADPVNNTDAVNKQFISTNLPNITTVAGIASDVTNVAADATDIGTVAGQISPTNNISTVAGLATEIGNLGTAQAVSDMNALAPASVRADMDTLADISSDITTVAGKASLITTDFVSDLNTVAVTDVINDLNTLATTDIVNDINTLATTDVINDLNLLSTSDFVSDLNTMATTQNVSNLNDVAGALTNINSVAGSLGSINLFGERYRVVTGDPTENNDEGDLIYNSTDNQLKYFNGTSFVNATTASITNGTFERQTYTVGTASGSYDGSTTVFPITYDVGFVDVYLNGVKLAPADFTATNGTTVTLGTAAGSGDTVDMVAYGIFNVGNISASNLTSGTIPDARFPATLPAASATNLTSIPSGNLTGTLPDATFPATLPAVSGANLTGISTDLVGDTTPQLGGNLDVQTHSIVSTSNQDITLTPDGTGNVVMNTDRVIINEDDSGSSANPILELKRNSSSPADGDSLGRINFVGKDSAGNDEIYGSVYADIYDVTNATEDSSLYLSAQSNVMRLYHPNTSNRFINFESEQILHWEAHRGTNYFCRLFWETPTQHTHVTLPNINAGTLGYCSLYTTSITSATSSITIDNLPTTFDTFVFHLNCHPVNDTVYLRARYLDTSGNPISLANTYAYYRGNDGANSSSDNSTYMELTGSSIGSGDFEGVIADLKLQNRNFVNTDVEKVPPTMQGLVVGHYNTNNASGGNFYGMMNNSQAQAIGGVQFFFSSGDVAKAEIEVYGIQAT